jgi:hypothetical protein
MVLRMTDETNVADLSSNMIPMRKNPIIQCKRPGCNKMFTRYYADKNGYISWTHPRKYCCHAHATKAIILDRENPIVQCKRYGCTKIFTKYFVRENGQVRWEKAREYCVGHYPRKPTTLEKMGTKLRLANLGKRRSKEHKRRYSLSKLGDKNPMWKDDDVGYRALHNWIRRNKPKPQSGLCEICNIVPLWDAACVTLLYNRKFENWKYLCRSCHGKVDYKNGTRKIPPARYGKDNPRWRNFNQVCQRCGSICVVRRGIQGQGEMQMQGFQCRCCKKYWSVKKSLLLQYYENTRIIRDIVADRGFRLDDVVGNQN